jgi:ferric-dicitrate binding protein FerR (iron transport regulator)
MRPRLNFKVFARFFWGVASEKEKSHVYNSEESDQMLKQEWEEVKNLEPISQEQQDEIFYQVKHNYRKKKLTQTFNQKFMRIAAIFILAIAVSSVLFIFTDIYEKLGSKEVAYIEKSNPKGQRSKIVLPDNSIVWLNADSKVRYAEEFTNKDNRNIELKGEAFFEVDHNPDKPFIVQVNGLAVTVLGTSFNIKGYDESEEIKTTLVHGKVGLDPGANSEKTYLKPGEMGVYNKRMSSVNIQKNIDVFEIISWKEGKLIFDNEPFVVIAAELERWYGVKFHIPAEIKGKYRYTMTITDENVQEVCKLIQETTPVDYRIEGKQVYFEIK